MDKSKDKVVSRLSDGAEPVKERPLAHRDRVMNELWNAQSRWFLRGKGDFRVLPQMMFEALEPLFEAAYEAGQDQWRDWLDGAGKAAEIEAIGVRGSVRPRFGRWWVSSDD